MKEKNDLIKFATAEKLSKGIYVNLQFSCFSAHSAVWQMHSQ